MMPQREAGESIHEQADSTYGSYQGEQAFAHQSYETSYEQPLRQEPVGKVYSAPRDNKNMLRLLMFVIAMVTLLVFAILCIFFLGGTGGWISLVVAAFAIFLITVMAIDKIN
jgi:fatty acid desaturase